MSEQSYKLYVEFCLKHGIGALPKDWYDEIVQITDEAINSAMEEIPQKFKLINDTLNKIQYP